jgi:murein peptide amidase A
MGPSDIEVRAYLQEFGLRARACGFVERALCATAAGPLVVWERPGMGPAAYLSAGMHGDEPAGPLAALELLKLGAFDHGPWRLCPALNPTGLAAGTRDCAEGIDLNRDYLIRRSAEVRAHAAWLESLPCPAIFLSLHEDWEYPGFYFYEINLDADRPQRAAAIVKAVAPWLAPEQSPLIDGHAVRAPGWIYHAAEADLPTEWPEAIFLAKRGCPLSFTFETPSTISLNERVAAHVAAVRSVIGTL